MNVFQRIVTVTANGVHAWWRRVARATGGIKAAWRTMPGDAHEVRVRAGLLYTPEARRRT